MSIYKTPPHSARPRRADASINAADSLDPGTAAADKIEVTGLKLDEDYGVNSDPYNCTGQHLISEVKQRKKGE